MGSRRGTDKKTRLGLRILLRMPLWLPLSETELQVSSISFSTAFLMFLADAKEITLIWNLISTTESGAWHAQIPHPFLDIYMAFSIGIKNLTPKLNTVIVDHIVILKTTTFSNCFLLGFFFFMKPKTFFHSLEPLYFAFINGAWN